MNHNLINMLVPRRGIFAALIKPVEEMIIVSEHGSTGARRASASMATMMVFQNLMSGVRQSFTQSF